MFTPEEIESDISALRLSAGWAASVGQDDRAKGFTRLADMLDAYAAFLEAQPAHQCPPDGSAVTPCCGRTPFELPRTDRMTRQERRR